MNALTVWKFALEAAPDVQEVEMPAGARLLSAGEQGSSLCIWALVDPAQPLVIRRIRIAGTGHLLTGEVDPGTAYVGRGTFAGGALQVHVFDLGVADDSH